MTQQFKGDNPRFSSIQVSADLDVNKQSLDHNKPTLDVSKQSLGHSKPTSDISSQLSKEAQEERRELLARAAEARRDNPTMRSDVKFSKGHSKPPLDVSRQLSK
ncbi:MAG TPA: hypothetical protein VHV10_05430, partial [Ktedonobacteraceae bacterium]|nr:hypothetical protein [Ktedonobacteraceae bacterium]